MIKVVIVILFIAMLASLTSGLTFLLKDMQIKDSKRLLYALGIRVTLAATLLLVIGYGIYSGKLQSTAPWDHKKTAIPEQEN